MAESSLGETEEFCWASLLPGVHLGTASWKRCSGGVLQEEQSLVQHNLRSLHFASLQLPSTRGSSRYSLPGCRPSLRHSCRFERERIKRKSILWILPLTNSHQNSADDHVSLVPGILPHNSFSCRSKPKQN